MASNFPDQGSDRRYVWSSARNAYLYADDGSLVPANLAPRSRPGTAATTANHGLSTQANANVDRRQINTPSRMELQSSIARPVPHPTGRTTSIESHPALSHGTQILSGSTAATALPIRPTQANAQPATSMRQSNSSGVDNVNPAVGSRPETTTRGQSSLSGQVNAKRTEGPAEHRAGHTSTARHNILDASRASTVQSNDNGRHSDRPGQSTGSRETLASQQRDQHQDQSASLGLGVAQLVEESTSDISLPKSSQHSERGRDDAGVLRTTRVSGSLQPTIVRDASPAANIRPLVEGTLSPVAQGGITHDGGPTAHVAPRIPPVHQSTAKTVIKTATNDPISISWIMELKPPPAKWKKWAVATDDNFKLQVAYYSPAVPKQPSGQRQQSLNPRKTLTSTNKVLMEEHNFRVHKSMEVGDVFEALFVLPQPESSSIITARGPFSNRSRPPKFVVSPPVSGAPADTFTALPISTYHDRGVAAPGVIKRHHVIIYSRPPPVMGPGEGPQRVNGVLEDPMMPYPILVIPISGFHLSPRARVNLRSIHAFQSTFPVHKLGRVHESSREALRNQFRLVWSDGRPEITQWNAANPGWPTGSVTSSNSAVLATTPSGVAQYTPSSSQTSNVAPQQQTQPTQAQALAVFDSRLRATAEAGRNINAPPPPQLTPRRRLDIATNPASSEQYFLTLETQHRAIAAFDRRFSRMAEGARERNLPMPVLPEPQRRMELAMNEQVREQYFSRIEAQHAAINAFDQRFQTIVEAFRARNLLPPPAPNAQRRIEFSLNEALRTEFFANLRRLLTGQ